MALTKTYSIEIEGQQAQATVGQIKERIAELEAAMDDATLGTRELEEMMLELGKAKGALKELDDAVDALDPKAKTAALLDFANGFTGAFGVATVAAESFGLASAESMEKYEAKLLSIITVMQGVEAIHKALNSETQSVLKSVLGMGNGWTIAGIKAKLFGTTTRAAITATGIGILIVLLGTVVANWDTIVKKVGEFKNSVAANFPAIGKFVDSVVDSLRDVASFLSFGFIDDAATAAQTKVDAAADKATAARIARRKRLITEEEAAGRATYALKQQQLADELKLLDKGTEEYADKLSEIRALKNAHDKSLAERDEAAWKEALDRQKKASEEAYKIAEENYNRRRELEGSGMEQVLAKAEEERKRRLEQAKLDGATQQTLLRIEADGLQEVLVELVAAGKRYGSEYLAIQNELRSKETAIAEANLADKKKAKEERERLQQEELEEMDAAYQKERVLLTMRNATTQEFTNLELQHLKTRAIALEKAGRQWTKEYEDILVAIQQLENKALDDKDSLMDRLLKKLFTGVAAKELDGLKQNLQKNMEVLYSSLLSITDNLVAEAGVKLDAQMEYIDSRLDELREKNDLIDERLAESINRSEGLSKQLDGARGTRREYLIQQIAKERQNEAALLEQRKKALAEEAKAAKQKEQIEEKRQELEAKARISQEATMAVTSAATAADIIATNIKAAKSAAGLPFPLSLAAIAASVAAVASAVLAGRKLAASIKEAKGGGNSTPRKFQKGGLAEGPSHDEGGIPFTVKGKAGYELEGGEFVTNKHAYRNNREAIERINAIGRSVRFVAIPEHQVRRKFAEGGQVPGGDVSVAATVAGEAQLSSGELSAIRTVLEKIERHAAATAAKEPVHIGPWESRKIVSQAQGLDRDEMMGKLI